MTWTCYASSGPLLRRGARAQRPAGLRPTARWWLLPLAGAAACAPARFVQPLAARQQAVSVSLGGPLIGYSRAVIPLPFLTAAYGYGFTGTLTGFGAVNITSALYGNAQVELGLSKQLLAPHGWVPGLSVSPAATLIYRPRDVGKLYPTLDAYARWDYRQRRCYTYVGVSNWVELSSTRAFGQPQPHRWLLTPLVGTVLGGEHWSYTLEGKVLVPSIANNFNTADYRTPFGTHGALGVYLGCTRKF